jgi:hypothetical protein
MAVEMVMTGFDDSENLSVSIFGGEVDPGD